MSLASFLAANAPARDLALDCGCGSGQLSVTLADHFKRVMAVDASPDQIAEARPHPGVTYAVARAERTGVADHVADLIVAAQAAHWFDLCAFWAEVERVARPSALIALVAYGRVYVDANIDEVLTRFHDITSRSHWPAERWLVVDGYVGITLPWTELSTPSLEMSCLWSLDELLAYLSTWSGVKRAERTLGKSPLADLALELAGIWGHPAQRHVVRWPLFIRCGHVDQPRPRVGAPTLSAETLAGPSATRRP